MRQAKENLTMQTYVFTVAVLGELDQGNKVLLDGPDGRRELVFP